MMYADIAYYRDPYGGTVITGDTELKKALELASQHIDTLTFNRIVGKGFERLTEFQRDIIKNVCCAMADFETENADMINSVLQSYSINGVSMSFGNSWNVCVKSGIAVKRDVYANLEKTGLCCLVLR